MQPSKPPHVRRIRSLRGRLLEKVTNDLPEPGLAVAELIQRAGCTDRGVGEVSEGEVEGLVVADGEHGGEGRGGV